MRPRAGFLLVYVLCAELVFVAAFILGTEPFYLLAPPAHRNFATDARGLAAMVIIVTVFGVGAMRRPVASLIGAVLASCLLDFSTKSSEATYPPSMLIPFIWISWLQGRLAYWVVRFLRFAHRLITRPDQPSLDGAAKPEAEAPKERARVDEAPPNTGATA